MSSACACLVLLPFLQERGEDYKRRHPGLHWPQTQYVLGDEERLPLEPGSVDGEDHGCLCVGGGRMGCMWDLKFWRGDASAVCVWGGG
jgi:hypothetical protein